MYTFLEILVFKNKLSFQNTSGFFSIFQIIGTGELFTNLIIEL
jgi:hypothetical protein